MTAGNLSGKIRHIVELYWIIYCWFSHSVGTFVINHGLSKKETVKKCISGDDWTSLEYNLGWLNVGTQASQQRLGPNVVERLRCSVCTREQAIYVNNANQINISANKIEHWLAYNNNSLNYSLLATWIFCMLYTNWIMYNFISHSQKKLLINYLLYIIH